jgi:hypothetical protein
VAAGVIRPVRGTPSTIKRHTSGSVSGAALREPSATSAPMPAAGKIVQP